MGYLIQIWIYLRNLNNNPQNMGLFNDKPSPLIKIGNSLEDTLTNLKASRETGVKIAHLNINFLYNKFEGLKLFIQDKFDILVLSETKLDDTYMSNQSQIEGFSIPFRNDRNAHGGGLLIYVRDAIPCKILTNQELPSNVEAIFIEFNFKKQQMASHGWLQPTQRQHILFLESYKQGN